MSMKKLIFSGIICFVMGLVVLPETYSLTAGQHNFYSNSQGPCEKCHGDISLELKQDGFINQVHNNIGCKGCHVTAVDISRGLTRGKDYHAVATASCLDCHDKNVRLGYPYNGRDATTIFLPNESHRQLALDAQNSDAMYDTNEACIGCHTHISVNVTVKKDETLIYDNNGWRIE